MHGVCMFTVYVCTVYIYTVCLSVQFVCPVCAGACVYSSCVCKGVCAQCVSVHYVYVFKGAVAVCVCVCACVCVFLHDVCVCPCVCV